MTSYKPEFFSNALPSVQLDSPIQCHLQWAAENIYLKPYPNASGQEGIERYQHGALHVGRCAFYIPILANLYRKFGDPESLAINEKQMHLLQIAAIFHDSGREAEGIDKWDEDTKE